MSFLRLGYFSALSPIWCIVHLHGADALILKTEMAASYTSSA